MPQIHKFKNFKTASDKFFIYVGYLFSWPLLSALLQGVIAYYRGHSVMQVSTTGIVNDDVKYWFVQRLITNTSLKRSDIYGSC